MQFRCVYISSVNVLDFFFLFKLIIPGSKALRIKFATVGVVVPAWSPLLLIAATALHSESLVVSLLNAQPLAVLEHTNLLVEQLLLVMAELWVPLLVQFIHIGRQSVLPLILVVELLSGRGESVLQILQIALRLVECPGVVSLGVQEGLLLFLVRQSLIGDVDRDRKLIGVALKIVEAHDHLPSGLSRKVTVEVLHDVGGKADVAGTENTLKPFKVQVPHTLSVTYTEEVLYPPLVWCRSL
ncbi:hypothetical protein AGDE_07929 [Angomonas deanei]|nr:hypothetical protein AGDE_07929 [Angomonas deanei]|eukprot:EPY34411.1 hypothetical protein AGDE_07929 [Angomonas deanei]